ncbi:hypothetical protein [Paenibacillus kobensis]|uniref:hypothetical protein n=1 Tax=Paenibacillus kobensis TaxID=59841 RepID=UPI000FD95266|nr:hypothetical protein [Paenibacillus kobensis]
MINELEKFIDAAIGHGKATDQGESRVANRHYSQLNTSAKLLLTEIDIFEALLMHEHPYVRLWSSSYLIDVDETRGNAITILEQLQLEPGLLGFDAAMVLEVKLTDDR